MPEEMLTAEDVARVLSVSRATAYKLLKRIPGVVRIGTGRRACLRISAENLKNFCERGGDEAAWQNSTKGKTRRTGGPAGAMRTAGGGKNRQAKSPNPKRAKLLELLS